MKLVIDTNIFLDNMNLDNASFRAIRNLANNNLLTIHMPFIVEREYLTNRIDNTAKEYDSILSSLQRLKKKKQSQNIFDNLETKLGEFEKLKEESIKFISKDFKDWQLDTRTIKKNVKSKYTENVWDAYFNGSIPFSSKKSRKDIPDAYIYEILKELCIDKDEVYFICRDGNLKDQSQNINGLIIHSNLEDFIKSDKCQALLREQKLFDSFNLLILEFKNHNETIVKRINKDLLDTLPGKIIRSNTIRDDNNEATIDMIDEADEININYDESSYYGSGIIVIPFKLKVVVWATYYIFKGDYYSLNDEETKQISISDQNDHYYMAEEEFYIEVIGNITLSIDIEALKDHTDIKQIVDYDSVEIDFIDNINLID